MSSILKQYEEVATPQMVATIFTSPTRRCTLERKIEDGYRVLSITVCSTLKTIGRFRVLPLDERDLPMTTTQDILDGVEIMQEMTRWSKDTCQRAIQTIMLEW